MRLRYRLMIPALMAAAAVHGQATMIHLDNYKIPVGKAGAAIGKVYTTSGAARGVQLSADTSGLFTVNKKGELMLKKKKSISQDGPVQYEVTLLNGSEKASFILVKDNFIRNKVVAHRGAWKHNAGSQNSLTSFRDAVRIGCEGSEFDVWLSSDGIPVLSHDPHIGGKKVEETPLAELQRVELKNGEHVPTFEQYIQEGMKQNHTHLVLELKPSGVSKERGQELTRKCMELIRKYKCEAWMLYISFDYEICKTIAAMDPHAKVAYLAGDKTPEQLKADGIWGFDYNWKLIDKDMNIFNEARKHKINVNIWTVNEKDKMSTYLKAGADYLTTDEPEIAIELVK